jgi:hypothetical protein
VKPVPPLALFPFSVACGGGGQEVTLGLLAKNGRGEQSNEADAKFTVRLGAGR